MRSSRAIFRVAFPLILVSLSESLAKLTLLWFPAASYSFCSSSRTIHSPSTIYLYACFDPQGMGTTALKLPSDCLSNGVAVADQSLNPPAIDTCVCRCWCHGAWEGGGGSIEMRSFRCKKPR